MSSAPRGLRLHIGVFGRRNAGKSSLLNALTGQAVSIVSAVPGTTTDPVEKAMELRPLGPVLWVDTAGVDDDGSLGAHRVERTRAALDRADLALLVATAADWGADDERLLAELEERGVPTVVALNKVDLGPPPPALLATLARRGLAAVETVASTGAGVEALRAALVAAAPADRAGEETVVGDLVAPGEAVVLVTPIDSAAPRGRLIHPQVQVLRELLDRGAFAVVAREHELAQALAALARRPALVVTDSQAFRQVEAATPAEVPLTSFSILFARARGDLGAFVDGARAVEALAPGDRVLVAEACAHHPTAEDIGRVKIPRWLEARAGGPLVVDHCQGHDFPAVADLAGYRLVVHCGACTQNRREVLARVGRCRRAGVPVSNYGLVIAASLGILERALQPFPAALAQWLGHARQPA